MKTNKKLVLMSLTLLSVVFGAHSMDNERNIKKEWENLQFNTVTTQLSKKCSLCNQDLSYVLANYFGEDSTKKFLVVKALPCHEIEGVCHKSSENHTSMNDYNRIEFGYNPTNKQIVTEKLEPITSARVWSLYKLFNTEKRTSSTYGRGQQPEIDSITDIQISDEYDHLNIFDITKTPENCNFSASSLTSQDDAIIVAKAEISNRKNALIVFGVKPCRPLCCLTKKTDLALG